MEASIKTLATKDDIVNLRKDFGSNITNLRDEIANVRYDLRKDIGESKADNIKWMFIFWVGQIGATIAIILLFLKK